MDVHKVGSFYKGGAVFKFKVICPHTIFMDNAKVIFVCFSENMFKKIELFNSTKLHLIHLCNLKKNPVKVILLHLLGFAVNSVPLQNRNMIFFL